MKIHVLEGNKKYRDSLGSREVVTVHLGTVGTLTRYNYSVEI